MKQAFLQLALEKRRPNCGKSDNVTEAEKHLGLARDHETSYQFVQ